MSGVDRSNIKVAHTDTYARAALRRMKKDKAAIAGTGIIIILVGLAVLAPWVAPYNPNKQNLDVMLEPPSWQHPLGTDQYGRDMASRIIFGTRYALVIGVAVVAIHFVVGVSLGLLAGYYGGLIESVIMRFVDVLLAIPSVVLAVTIAGFLGGGIQNVIIAVGAIGWRAYTRLVRAEVLAAKQRSFVESARAIGCSNLRIILRHIMPYTLAPVIAYTSLGIATAILWAAALSFLGLGAQPPTPEWGAMLADGREFMEDGWWVATFPGIAIMITVIGFNFFGDALRNALDPKTEKKL
ncbi:MAG: ABC transporter permease [Deltaproteobacteria bacterium]|nr:ABC transporter permease [Deltaproteobacteria bacterium]